MHRALLRSLLRSLLLLAFAASTAHAQTTRVVVFDGDGPGPGYHDASLGVTSGGDSLGLAGPAGDRLPVEAGADGRRYGVLRYRHGSGSFTLSLGANGWAVQDVAGFDSLVFAVNGPAAVPAAELPRVQLQDEEGDLSLSVRLPAALGGLDADPATWQRVALPLGALTAAGRFDPARFRAVRFTAGDRTAAVRTLYLDDLAFVQNAPPAAPRQVTATTGHARAVVRWRPGRTEPLGGFRVYRSLRPDSGFTPVAETKRTAYHFVDTSAAVDVPSYYRVHALGPTGQEGLASVVVSVTPRAGLSDEAFLDDVQRRAFDYFWREANPANGLVKDRSTAGSAASIAAVGFGLSALTVGIDRGWITREQGRDRVLATLRFFWNAPQSAAADATGYKGFFYHFLDLQTGRRAGRSELSTIDTALLLGGVLHVEQYFDGADAPEADVRTLARAIYERVDWTWAQPNPPAITAGWFPESGFIGWDWRGYNEAMILYLLALGSPTHPVGADAWEAWTAPYPGRWQTHYGFTYLAFPPLFGHQYSHVWIDFRGRPDAFMQSKGIDYFENSRRATLASRAYAVANPEGWIDYGPNVWGLTASDDPVVGYLAHGAPPEENDNGTLAPTAPGGSYAFTPDASLAALRYLYDVYRDGLWGTYGFRDAFNPSRSWYATDYLGIDQGPILLMIENGRTERVWDVFMRSEAIQRGLTRAGFQANTAAEAPEGLPGAPVLAPAYPNPFTGRTTLRYTLPHPGRVTLAVYDLLGRRVATLVDAVQAAGAHAVVFDAPSLPGGVYVCVLRQGGAVHTGKLVRLR